LERIDGFVAAVLRLRSVLMQSFGHVCTSPNQSQCRFQGHVHMELYRLESDRLTSPYVVVDATQYAGSQLFHSK